MSRHRTRQSPQATRRREDREPERRSRKETRVASTSRSPSRRRSKEHATENSRSSRRRGEKRGRTRETQAAGKASGSRDKGKRRRSRSPYDNRPKRSWADRMSDSEEETTDLTKPIDFPDSDVEDQTESKIVEVSEKTRSLLFDSCTQRMPNPDRLRARSQYPLPKVPATRTPQLDAMMKPEASTATKAADRQLAKVQSLLLDSLAPLSTLLELHNKGEQLNGQDTIKAVKTAVQLIGNSNAHLSHLRRVRILSDMNKALFPVVEEDKNFKTAAPQLFGLEFAQRGKNLVDQMKAIRSTTSRKPDRRSQFFRGGPPNRGGFGQRYGRGGGPSYSRRERPYQGKFNSRSNNKGQNQT